MTYFEPAARATLISGLRALADYLESNPCVPVSGPAVVYAFPPDSACAGMRADIDKIAETIGSQPEETADGAHYVASRYFGAVEYRAIAICEHHHSDREETGR
jgi:hypothetical protein